MTLIKTIEPEEAQGMVKAVYDGFQERMGRIPNVIKLHTASDKIFPHFMGLVGEFAEHPNLTPVLQAYMRCIISHREGYEYCVKFQTFLLKARGETQENIENALEDVCKAWLPEKQKQLLIFVLDMLYDKEMNTKKRLEELRKLGWTDQEIYELSFLGGMQKGAAKIVGKFGVEIDF